MEIEKTVTLTWLERHTIRYALLAQIDRLTELLDDAVKLHMDEDTFRAIYSKIWENSDIIEKLHDRG